jgi:endonuclease III
MIDPAKISNFNLSINELEENILFWVGVANKTAKTISEYLDRLLLDVSGQTGSSFDPNLHSPFELIRNVGSEEAVANLLRKHRFGCFNLKAKSYVQLANGGMDLRKCTVEDLEAVHGIGPKTARCFMIHTRPNMRLAGLDTHILRFMRDVGLNAPTSTPTGKKYKYWEEKFLSIVPEGVSVADYDLAIWNLYRDALGDKNAD